MESRCLKCDGELRDHPYAKYVYYCVECKTIFLEEILTRVLSDDLSEGSIVQHPVLVEL